jgi:hypothetical protein
LRLISRRSVLLRCAVFLARDSAPLLPRLLLSRLRLLLPRLFLSGLRLLLLPRRFGSRLRALLVALFCARRGVFVALFAAAVMLGKCRAGA